MTPWDGIPFAKFGGRKMVVAIWLSSLATGLAAFGKFTDQLGLLFSVIYAGFSYADTKNTVKALEMGVNKDYGQTPPASESEGVP